MSLVVVQFTPSKFQLLALNASFRWHLRMCHVRPCHAALGGKSLALIDGGNRFEALPVILKHVSCASQKVHVNEDSG